ncbi:MAG: hypothetical protein Q4B78_02920, partial [Bacillota bacterium]|nr:hypothetical protein [Bacillota bacterium]
RGFYVRDLINYANINTGDIQSLKFYVEDHKGIQAAFDAGALFRTRYYYDDIPAHRTTVYGKKTIEKEVTETIHHDAEYEVDENGDKVLDEEGNPVVKKEAYDEEVTKTVKEEIEDKSKVLEYTFDSAKKYAKAVQPMLALEDNWAQFTEEAEHAKPNFATMNTGSRFRLLFGQTSPTESLTSSSAKYVSRVYVTLRGMPTIGKMTDLKDKKGSHTTSMQVNIDNKDIRDSLSELINIKSTNTDVIKITGVKVVADSQNSDLATVKVTYKVVGNGEAAITAGIGAKSDPLSRSNTINVTDSKASDKDHKDASDKGGSTKDGNGDGDKKKDDKGTAKDAKTKEKQKADLQMASDSAVFELSDSAVAQLNEALKVQDESEAAKDVEAVTVKDTEKEDKDRERRIMVMTGLGCAGMCGLGGAAEAMSFRVRLRGKKIYK